jgi:hypothetical protein
MILRYILLVQDLCIDSGFPKFQLRPFARTDGSVPYFASFGTYKDAVFRSSKRIFHAGKKSAKSPEIKLALMRSLGDFISPQMLSVDLKALCLV